MTSRKLSCLFACLIAGFFSIDRPRISCGGTSITFNSQPGDYIGGGVNHTWTPIDGTFSISNSNGFAAVSFDGGPTWWTLDFAAPAGQPLVPGSYNGAMRYPFQGPTAPGLSVSGSGRGSNTLTGRFDILQMTYGPNGQLQQFSADFEQHSEGAVPALFGNVLYDVADSVASPDQIRAATHMTAQQLQNLAPYMSQLANVPTGVYLTGQPGDYIVGNQSLTFLPSNSTISVSGTAAGVSVSVSAPGHNWTLDFVPPSTVPLSVGDWGSATRYPFQSPTTPGLSVSGDGRGSNTLTGDFEVLQEAFDSAGNIATFDALFEQHSEGGIPASFGRVRFNAVPEPSGFVLGSFILLALVSRLSFRPVNGGETR
jgi:hypothetical protein